MVNIKVSKSDWSTAKDYWNDLQEHFHEPDDLKKVDFVNQIIFESARSCQNESESDTSESVTTRTVPEKKIDDSPTFEMNIDEINEKIKESVNCQVTQHTYVYHEIKKEKGSSIM